MRYYNKLLIYSKSENTNSVVISIPIRENFIEDFYLNEHSYPSFFETYKNPTVKDLITWIYQILKMHKGETRKFITNEMDYGKNKILPIIKICNTNLFVAVNYVPIIKK